MPFFDRSRLARYRGFVHMRLGRPEAPSVLQEAMASSKYTRANAIATADLARFYVRQREPEEACTFLGQALGLVSPTASPILLKRIREVRAELEPWNELSAVKELDARFAMA